MKALIISPADRTKAAFLASHAPLALAPMLGRSLLDLTLAHLAGLGAKQVLVLAAERPEKVRVAVSQGEAWGVRVEVHPEQRELTVAEARAADRHGQADGNLPFPTTPDDLLDGKRAMNTIPPVLKKSAHGWLDPCACAGKQRHGRLVRAWKHRA